jgi:hypothetical protein
VEGITTIQFKTNDEIHTLERKSWVNWAPLHDGILLFTENPSDPTGPRIVDYISNEHFIRFEGIVPRDKEDIDDKWQGGFDAPK